MCIRDSSYTYENNHLTKATYIGTDGKSIDYKYAYTDDVLTSIVDAEGNEYRIAFKNGCIEKFTNPMGEETIYKIANNYKSTKVSSFNGSSRTENPYECSYTFNAVSYTHLERTREVYKWVHWFWSLLKWVDLY